MNEKQIKKTVQGKDSIMKVYDNGDKIIESKYYDIKVPKMENLSFEVKLRSLITPLVLDDLHNEYRFMSKYVELLNEVKTQEEIDALLNFLDDIKIGELGKMYSTSLMELTKNHQINNEKDNTSAKEVETKNETTSSVDLQPYKHKIMMLNMQYFTLTNTPTPDTEECFSLSLDYGFLKDELNEKLQSLTNEEDRKAIQDLINDIEQKELKLFSMSMQNKMPKPKKNNTTKVNLSPYISRIEMIEMQYDELMDKPMKDPEDFNLLASKLKAVIDDLYDLKDTASMPDKDIIMDLINKTEKKRINLISKAEKLEEIGKSFGV